MNVPKKKCWPDISFGLQRKIYEGTIFFMGFISFVFLIGAMHTEVYQYDYTFSVDGIQVSEKGKALWGYTGLTESISKEGSTVTQKTLWAQIDPPQSHVKQIFVSSETFAIFGIISCSLMCFTSGVPFLRSLSLDTFKIFKKISIISTITAFITCSISWTCFFSLPTAFSLDVSSSFANPDVCYPCISFKGKLTTNAESFVIIEKWGPTVGFSMIIVTSFCTFFAMIAQWANRKNQYDIIPYGPFHGVV